MGNDHLRVTFEDVLAEPEGIHSMNCVWSNSYKCFNCCKDLCYMIMTLCCGICIAAEWGCEFAEIAFCHIWYVTPCFKVCELNCGCLQKLYVMLVHCCRPPVRGHLTVLLCLQESISFHSMTSVAKQL